MLLTSGNKKHSRRVFLISTSASNSIREHQQRDGSKKIEEIILNLNLTSKNIQQAKITFHENN
jgi:hypothetical protein